MIKFFLVIIMLSSNLGYSILQTISFTELLSDPITFQKTVGGDDLDRGVAIQQTCDGGYIAVGVTKSFGAGGEDVYLVRTDSMGDTLWTRTFGGEKKDNGWAVSQTSDSGFIVAGFTESYGSGGMDFYVIRTDSEGNPLWSQTYGGEGDDYCWDLDVIFDNGYILVGETGAVDQYRKGDKDFFLVRIDEDGNLLWQKIYGGPETDRGFAVQQTQDGGFVMVGSTTSYGAGDVDAYLIKTDDNGEVEWAKPFGTAAFDMGHDVRQKQNGGYVIFGYTESYGAKSRDIWLMGADSEGKEEWSQLVGGSEADHATRGVLTAGNGFVLLGYTKSFGAGHWDVYLVKMNAAGDTVWTRTYGGPWPDTGYGIEETDDGGFILTGQTWSSGRGDSDFLLIKTDENGQLDIDPTNHD